MTVSKEQLAKWHERLLSAFEVPDGPDEMPNLVLKLADAETNHQNRMNERGAGFRTLILSYQDFAIRTLEEAPQHGNLVNVYNFALNWAALRRMRCCWIVYSDGYYNDAGALLRGVFEITMYLSCVLSGRFRFSRMHDVELDIDKVSEEQFRKAARKRHQELAREIREQVYGEASGLSCSQRKSIETLLWLHHSHVHRSESSVIQEVLEIVKTQQPPPVRPEFELERASRFCNPAVLAAWTHIRVLRYLSVPSQFSDGWRVRFNVLDAAFRAYVDGWDKPMKEAYIALIGASYEFDDAVAVKQVLKGS